jgi:hypothetical protein
VRRPSSVAEVAEWSLDQRAFHFNVADFLDEFRRCGDPAAMLESEPQLLRETFPEGDVADAYLAAVAVSLAREVGAAPPAWAWKPRRKLSRPWFAHPGAALRAMLLAESPAPFRERNLFVSANAMSRA